MDEIDKGRIIFYKKNKLINIYDRMINIYIDNLRKETDVIKINIYEHQIQILIEKLDKI